MRISHLKIFIVLAALVFLAACATGIDALSLNNNNTDGGGTDSGPTDIGSNTLGIRFDASDIESLGIDKVYLVEDDGQTVTEEEFTQTTSGTSRSTSNDGKYLLQLVFEADDSANSEKVVCMFAGDELKGVFSNSGDNAALIVNSFDEDSSIDIDASMDEEALADDDLVVFSPAGADEDEFSALLGTDDSYTLGSFALFDEQYVRFCNNVRDDVKDNDVDVTVSSVFYGCRLADIVTVGGGKGPDINLPPMKAAAAEREVGDGDLFDGDSCITFEHLMFSYNMGARGEFKAGAYMKPPAALTGITEESYDADEKIYPESHDDVEKHNHPGFMAGNFGGAGFTGAPPHGPYKVSLGDGDELDYLLIPGTKTTMEDVYIPALLLYLNPERGVGINQYGLVWVLGGEIKGEDAAAELERITDSVTLYIDYTADGVHALELPEVVTEDFADLPETITPGDIVRGIESVYLSHKYKSGFEDDFYYTLPGRIGCEHGCLVRP
jgi:hypothetical protein